MSNSLEQLVGQLIIAGFRGKNSKNGSLIKKYIKEYNIGGVILYDEDLEIGGLGSRNIQSPKQVKELTDYLKSISDNQLLIGIDQEGGNVNRLKSDYGFQKFPSWKKIGSLNNKLITQQFSYSIADTLFQCGINLNFAPVLDLDFGPETNIGKSNRAISIEPIEVISHSKIFISELQKYGIISCGKHFPGQGSAKADTHLGYTDISNTWTVKDLLPFDELIQSKDLNMIMIAHTFDKKLDANFPASLSKNIITNMLRDDLGFNGVVICDDPSMKAISNHYNLNTTFELMLNAGVDLFCLGNNLHYDPQYIEKSIQSICYLIQSGKIKKSRIDLSVDRIKALKIKYNLNG